MFKSITLILLVVFLSYCYGQAYYGISKSRYGEDYKDSNGYADMGSRYGSGAKHSKYGDTSYGHGSKQAMYGDDDYSYRSGSMRSKYGNDDSYESDSRYSRYGSKSSGYDMGSRYGDDEYSYDSGAKHSKYGDNSYGHGSKQAKYGDDNYSYGSGSRSSKKSKYGYDDYSDDSYGYNDEMGNNDYSDPYDSDYYDDSYSYDYSEGYFVLSKGLYTEDEAKKFCKARGLKLAAIDEDNMAEANNKLKKKYADDAWIKSWNTDSYVGSCMILTTGKSRGAITAEINCYAKHRALCN